MDNHVTIPDLLLDFLGRKSPDELAERIARVSADEWDSLLLQARQHGIAPIVFFRLESLEHTNIVPPQIMHQLHTAFLTSAARNILIYKQLREILEVMHDAEIQVIVLKGGYLAESIYSEVSLRPMADIDIMLKKEDLARGEKALTTMGYSSLRPYMPEVDSAHHQHILPFTKEDCVPVEVHWNIFDPEDPFHQDVEGLWGRARRCTVAGVAARTLCLEDLLLHLAIHSSYHHCFNMGLIKFCDIDLLLRKFGDKVDWQTLLNRAEEWGFDRCLLLTLKIVSELLGTYLPRDGELVVQSAELAPEVLSLAVEQLFQQRTDTVLSPTMTDLIEKKGMFKKMAFLFSRLFTSKMEMARMYPVSPTSPKIYMYYPIRIKDLLCRYGKGVLGVVKGDKPALVTLSQRQKKEKLKMWMRREFKGHHT